jgi:hypothetical protein
MDRNETRSSSTNPEVFGSCIIANHPPGIGITPHLVFFKLSKSFPLAMKIQILEVIVQ